MSGPALSSPERPPVLHLYADLGVALVDGWVSRGQAVTVHLRRPDGLIEIYEYTRDGLARTEVAAGPGGCGCP
jgi:hypothetical protein